MKFSYQWIKDCVPGLDVFARELEQLITVRTAECDGIHPVGTLLAGARVAVVKKAESVAGTHVVKATVGIGDADPIIVICGAPNCRAGLQTIWTDVGRKRIQGVDSNGMLASAAELEIGRDASGIIEWNEPILPLLPDDIIEIDNKSLTHRPDLWGHLGMAREVAAITGRELRDPVDLSLLPGGSNSYEVRVLDAEICPRFSTVVFENVHVRPSPYWLQYRLTAIGLNPINNIVDITNFVMAELAQPMHAFDRNKLRGDRLIVRPAHDGEQIDALNGERYTLTSNDTVVSDEEGAVSIAGIIGGQDSAISDATTEIVFESANWKASAIRKTSSALKLRTDASMRFEKAQDPVNTVRALARAIALMKLVCPEARLAGRLTDVYDALPKPQTIALDLAVLHRKLGRDVPAEEVQAILERLGFHVTAPDDRAFLVTVPSWRATKDVQVADDLVEEVGRMIGYDSIPPAPPLVACTVPPDNPQRLWYRELRALLTARGFTEVYNYSFLSDAQAERFELAADDQVRVANPIASDQNLLRSSLIPGIFANLELNAKHFSDFRLFELAREIHGHASSKPTEITHLVAARYSREGDGVENLFELKRIAESVAPLAHARPVTETQPFEHPARTADILLGDTKIGRLFETHPQAIEGRAAVLDLNLHCILAIGLPKASYTQLRRFPSSSFDLTIFAPVRELAAEIEARLRTAPHALLEQIEYIREYAVPQQVNVPAMKSITYRFTVGAQDRTLSSEEINAVRSHVIESMRSLGYDMRV